MGFARVFYFNGTPNLFTRFTRKVELIGGIELEATPSWEQRPGDGRNRIVGGVKVGSFEV